MVMAMYYFDKVIKSTEFSYVDNINKVTRFIDSNMNGKRGKISYESLIRGIGAPTVHYKEKCSKDCKQKQKCGYIKMKNRISDIYDI